uniref:NADH dehydrogenase [ubiquinone] 1 beta subcomplex subunit 2, mitochondrial n=1 Tax=Gorilla gorilla gorilla TaxID=9595 RepID=G3SD19_GORGO
MSALTRLASFARVGGRLFRSGRARTAGDGGVRQASNMDHRYTGDSALLWPSYKSSPEAEMLLPSSGAQLPIGISNPSQYNISRMRWRQYMDFLFQW